MIFKYAENIFDLYPEAIVHPVNCIGLCHDSLSKKIKKIWPDYFREYTRNCLRKKLDLAQSYSHPINSLFGTKLIIALTIRYSWQEKLKKETMEKAIVSLMEECKKHKINDIAIPSIEGIPPHWLEQELKKASFLYTEKFLTTVYLFS